MKTSVKYFGLVVGPYSK